MDMTENDVLECRESMYITINKILKNPQDSEDALQDALCRAITKLEQFDPEKANLNTWCCTIAKNYALMVIRERKKVGYQSDEALEFVATDDEEYEDISETYEKVVKLIKEHAGLKVYGLNEAFIDYYLNKGVGTGTKGRRFEDLSAEYGVNAGTIRTVFRRASTEIRKKFMRQNKLF